MRSGFGKLAQKLRSNRGMSQKDFADLCGLSVSRISNIEYQRVAVSEDVVRLYLKALSPAGADAHELRKLASYSNSYRNAAKDEAPNPAVIALLREVGDKLSPKAVAKIQEIIERESGESVSALSFSSSKSKTSRKKIGKRPIPSVKRFVEICILASDLRRQFSSETSKLDVGRLLENLSLNDDTFDFRISERLPVICDGAFACIIGQKVGNLLLIEEDRYLSAERGVYFARHVIAHEIGHHILHKDELSSDGELLFAPQELAKNSPKTATSTEIIEQVVDSQIEVEAECFATFLLVPWEAFIKGTDTQYLAKDYGEQPTEIKRYMPYFKQDAVLYEFKDQLWHAGLKSHPIFSSSPLQ